jgi:hypothetical protein
MNTLARSDAAMSRTQSLFACFGVVVLTGCSGAPPFDDPFAPYAQRTQTITLSAGNAKEANAAIHVIDPWPRYVYDTRIPGDGHRMAEAVERYEDVAKLKQAPKPISSVFDQAIGVAGGGGGGSSQ